MGKADADGTWVDSKLSSQYICMKYIETPRPGNKD